MSVRVSRTPASAETGTYDGNKSILGSLTVQGPQPWIDVRAAPYNADPTGVADATAAIQAALNAAILVGNGNQKGCEVRLGHGCKYKITDTLTIPHGSAQYGAVALLGGSMWSTYLDYQGPNDRPAIYIDKQAYSTIGRFSLHRSGSRGSSMGIQFGSSTGTGTQTLSNLIQPIWVDGFNVGVYLGDAATGVAVSEHVFQFLRATSCDYGVYLYNYNTLNIKIEFLDTNQCGYGVYGNTAGQIYIEAGAGADNTIADFRFGTNARNEIRNWRSERVTRLLQLDDSSVILDNIAIADYKSGHDGVAIETQGNIVLRNSDLSVGKIVSGNNPSVLIEHSIVGGPQYMNYLLAGRTGGETGTVVTAIGSSLNNVGVLTFTGALAVYVRRTSTTWDLISQISKGGDLLTAFSSKAGAPTSAEIPAGMCAVFKDTGTGAVKVYVNDGGTIKSVGLS